MTSASLILTKTLIVTEYTLFNNMNETIESIYFFFHIILNIYGKKKKTP